MSIWSAFATMIALDLVGVVGAAAQQRRALLDADDAGEGAVFAGRVADDVDAVAGDDRLAAQLARARGGDHALVGPVLVDQHGVAAAVDAEHAPVDGVGVPGRVLGARAVAASVRPHPDVGLVELGFVVVVVVGVSTTSCAASAARARELGHRLGGRADVVDLDARARRGRRARRSWPCGGRGARARARRAAARDRCGCRRRARDLAAEPVELADERGDAVGLVPADVPDAVERARRRRRTPRAPRGSG